MTTNNEQESFMTQVLSQPGKHSPGQIIAAVAMGRWLNVSEIETLLNHEHNVLAVSTAPPTTPPPSGTLLLFNRSITRNYKDDGHEWIRKRNSNKVREDHVKLRVGGKFRVSGCYVHSSKSMTFHRRAYHLLNPDSGTALYPVTNASKAGKNNTPPSLILVHYLDTKVASANCNRLIERGIDINPALYPSSMHSQNAMLAARMEHGSFTDQSHRSFHHHPQDAFHFEKNNHGEYDPGDFMNSFSSGFDGSADLEGKAIDFLWDVVVEEGNDDVKMNGSNLSELLTPELIEKMFDSETVGNLFENGELFGMTHSEMDVEQQSENNSNGRGSNNTMEVILEEPFEEVSRETKPTALILGQEAYIPEIVDITPESITVDRGPVKMVISCNHSAPGILKRDDDSFVWKQFACFFENMGLQGTRVKMIKCTEVKLLNPYTYQCLIPDCFLKTGSYQIMVIALKVEASVQYSRTMVAQDLSRLIDTVFQTNGCEVNLPTRYHSVKFEDMEVKLLTQLSRTSLDCTNTHNTCDHSSESGSGSAISSSVMRSDLPAPPPAMALVATMLSDFPNPPPGAVLPPESTIRRMDSKLHDGKMTFEEAKETFSTDANRMFSSAMEATVSGSTKKRSSSHVEIPRRSTLDRTMPVSEAPTAADLWASQTSNAHDIETNAEEVDRHCKIRFVERLTSVISEAGGDVFVKDALPENVTRADFSGGHCLTIDPNEMKALDDDELDNILDSLLVKIVESLVEMSASECDIQEELNAPDRSGFTLLHYAALYNLQSLIPVLLSRGANPDIKSLRGDVTPLHLACGSGNTAIVQLLLRHGCSLEVADCFGSYPVDHAMRSGFHALAALLQQKAQEEKGMKAGVDREVDQARLNNEEQRKSKMKELEKMRLQEAFANLSLKDKLALNMLFKQRIQNRSAKKRVANAKEKGELDTELSKCNGVSNGSYPERAVDLTEMEIQKNDDSEYDSDELSSVISESDKESLDIAMKLMNAKELEELEKSTDVHRDLKDWMLRRNYESLKETSETLRKTLQEHKKEKVSRSSPSTPDSSPSVDESSTKYAKSAAIRSLKNMQSQAIASLVLRKNLKETMKTKGH